MTDTTKLQLPQIAANQDQKHVTHNEGLKVLDAIIQLSVLDKDLTAAPGSPAAGDRYIVAASATGDWAGEDGNVAAWQDGVWAFYEPRTGWIAWVEDEATLYRHSGGSWGVLQVDAGTLGGTAAANFARRDENNNFAEVLMEAHRGIQGGYGDGNGSGSDWGVPIWGMGDGYIGDAATGVGYTLGSYGLFWLRNAASDALADVSEGLYIRRNNVTVAAFGNVGAELAYKLKVNGVTTLPGGLGVGGATPDATNAFAFYGTNMLFNSGGSIDATFNKDAAGDDASFSFKQDFAAKALMGLLGNNDWTLKVGASFTTAIVVDESTGKVDMPETPTFMIHGGGRFYCYTDNRWISDSDDAGSFMNENFAEDSGTGVNPDYEFEHQGRYLPKGTKLHTLDFVARSNSSEVTDMEFVVVLCHPNPITRWETGMDSDAEQTVIEIYRDTYFFPTVGDDFTGAFAIDLHRRKLDLDYTVPEDGLLKIYAKPIGTLTTTRYIYCSYMYRASMPFD